MPKGESNKNHTGEFKQAAIEDMRENNQSQCETAKKYNIPRASVQRWERIYLEEGPEGLYIERRGRKSKGRPAKLQKQVEEDLIAENQRLRAEVAFLKKLNALVLKEEQQNRKHK